MHPETIVKKLGAHMGVFQNLLEGSLPKMYFFRPDKNSWCLLEVICHLFDEEVEDFRDRVNHILTTPHLPLKSISPDKWPVQRNYIQKDFNATLQGFLRERKHSIEWLSSLKDPKWDQVVDHPEVGSRSARKFLVNWLAHDYHHIRQINRIHHAYLKYTSGEDLTYAGKW